MATIADFCQFMNEFSPTAFAEDWDNVGLLVGDELADAKNVMTCLTVTPVSVAEAIERSADLIVTHHPMPFHSLRRITSDDTVGRLLLQLIQNSIAVYSPHTGFDSAAEGINQTIAQRLSLASIRPIQPFDESDAQLGSGRMGTIDRTVELVEFAQALKLQFQLPGIHYVGEPNAKVQVVGIACGSGGSFLADAIRRGCDTLLTGESDFHTCLEAKARAVSIVLLGHFGSERFAVELLADRLANQFPDVECWACVRESDPVNWL